MSYKNIIKIIVCIVLGVSATACSSRGNVHLVDYQSIKTLYIHKQDKAAYKEGLRQIIANVTEERGDRNKQKHIYIPGLYAEYGLFLLQDGDKSGARKYFLMEKNTWPESSSYIDQLITKTK